MLRLGHLLFTKKRRELEQRKDQRSRKGERTKLCVEIIERNGMIYWIDDLKNYPEHSVNETNGPTITETAKGNGSFGPIFFLSKTC